jgi:hypothetical protein
MLKFQGSALKIDVLILEWKIDQHFKDHCMAEQGGRDGAVRPS